MKSDIQAIKGEYRADENRIRQYYKRSLVTFVKAIGIPWFIMMLFLLSIYNGFETIYLALGITGALALSGVIWYARIDGLFEKTKIIFGDYQLIREGKGLTSSQINYEDIGKIIIQRRGIIVIEKGFFSLLDFYISRSPLTSGDNVIFIPYMIRDYDLIKDFIQKKKYVR